MERTNTARFSAKASGAFLSVSQGFSLGHYFVHYYSLTMVAAILVAYLFALIRAKKANLDLVKFDDFCTWLLVIGFLSARIYYVIFYWPFYAGNFSEVFKIWHGGLSIYGALIGGIIFTYFYAKRRAKKGDSNFNFFALTDTLAFGLPAAQAIGRLGNYFNYEAFGKPVSSTALFKMFVPLNFRPFQYKASQFFAPTFLYEMIWDLLVFAIIFAIAKWQSKTTSQKFGVGFLTGVYLSLYSLGRFFIELDRTDSAFWHILGTTLRGDAVTAGFAFCAGLAIIWKAKSDLQP